MRKRGEDGGKRVGERDDGESRVERSREREESTRNKGESEGGEGGKISMRKQGNCTEESRNVEKRR